MGIQRRNFLRISVGGLAALLIPSKGCSKSKPTPRITEIISVMPKTIKSMKDDSGLYLAIVYDDQGKETIAKAYVTDMSIGTNVEAAVSRIIDHSKDTQQRPINLIGGYMPDGTFQFSRIKLWLDNNNYQFDFL